LTDTRREKKDKKPREALEPTLPAKSEPPLDAPALAPTANDERYRLGTELGRGGMGRVVEAFDTQLGRTVALKEVLAPKTGAGRGIVRRFAREVALTAKLEHPSIVPIYDSGVGQEGRPFYVMRRVSGRPFDELIERARGLDERLTLIPTLLKAIEAVGHAHRRGVIHRDVKPQNILVGEHGETVVIDWGLAKVIGEGDEVASFDSEPGPGDSLRTQIGSVFGTPGFMAPEQARGEELDTRGDVYALGATLYHLLAGKPPHAGNSATEVMEKTMRHEVRPLELVAPGAPPDLVAIVKKALSLEQEERYPDAGALADDVRRFLAGQLVAAHSYTRRQRIARFARRHRGALSVLAVAALAVAVMAWIGVHRIITERDAATQARGEALTEKQAAEQAAARLAERNDALLLMQAQGLLATDPTHAVAVLKQLGSKSPRLAEARALAEGAAVRGVAWALQSTPELTIQSELDATGRQLLQVSRDGMVRVWDLDRRRLVLARPFARTTRALWVAAGKVLVLHPTTPPQLLDPVANTSEALAIDPFTDAEVSARGERVLFTSDKKVAKLLDVASRAVTPLALEGTIDELAIAPDGSWAAVSDKKQVVLFDASGRELARRTVGAQRLIVSRDRKLAVIEGTKLFECTLDPKPTWTEVPVNLPPRHYLVDAIYRGGELDIFATTMDLYAWNGKTVFTRMHLDKIGFGLVGAGADTVIISNGDSDLTYLDDATRGVLHLPSVLAHLRVAARPGSSRVVAVGDGVVLVYDLDAFLPQRVKIPTGAHAEVVDEDTLLVDTNMDDQWFWLDLPSGKPVYVKYDLTGLPFVADVDPASGRALVRETTPRGVRLMLMRKNTTEVMLVAEGRDTWGRLVPGDAVVYGLGDGRLFVRQGKAEGREIAKLDGVSDSAVALGYLKIAARSTGGEVIRYDIAASKLERTRVPVGTNGFVAADRTGRVLVVEDSRLLLWDGAIQQIAAFDKPIVQLSPVEGGASVVLQDREMQLVKLTPNATAHRLLPPARHFPVTSADGKLVAGLGANSQVELVELPSRAHWTLPVLREAGDQVFDISPTGHRIVQGSLSALMIWQLPRPGTDYGAWLDELTNASIDRDGVFVWPWQVATKPATP
jgi:WD40 repeat protein